MEVEAHQIQARPERDLVQFENKMRGNTNPFRELGLSNMEHELILQSHRRQQYLELAL